MLDQIAAPGPLLGGIGQQTPHDIELVVTREDLFALLLARLLVLLLDDLGVILKDVRQAVGREGALPQVGSLEAIRVGGIAGAVIPSLVEGQKP